MAARRKSQARVWNVGSGQTVTIHQSLGHLSTSDIKALLQKHSQSLLRENTAQVASQITSPTGDIFIITSQPDKHTHICRWADLSQAVRAQIQRQN